EGAEADPPPEPGVDVEGLLEEAEAAEAAEGAVIQPRSSDRGGVAADGRGDRADAAWEPGEIVCEPVPGMLGADEIAGARRATAPQPDGTSRYVAIGADGTVRTDAFRHDGDVERLADTTVGTPVAPDAAVAPTPEGVLVVTPPGQAPRPVDLR